MLRQQVISNLSLARKAGEALTGAFKVEEALQRGPVRLLFHGRDAGSDGVRKLNRLARPETLICGFMETAELDLAFGRANVVHAAVAAGGLAEKLAICVSRVAAYEGLAFKDVESEDRI
jgi:ribosomal protein L7Ae-like RNA K-turn-binding protein